MKTLSALLVILSLTVLFGAAPASGADYTITDNNKKLTFPNTVLTGDDIYVYGNQAPTFTMTVNVSTGWNVTLQCTNFVRGSYVIPAANLSYTASGGLLTRRNGQQIDPTYGPMETGLSGSLAGPLKCVSSQPGFGVGRYDWLPNSTQFVLVVPASAYAQTGYTSTLTATVSGGP